MEIVRKINDDLAIAGPVTFQQLQQLAEDGFASVLSLRSLEKHLLQEEQQHVESLGLHYVNLPVAHEVMSPAIAAHVLKQMRVLPKPALVCCNSARLAAAMVLMHIAMSQGETLQQAFHRAKNLGLFEISVPVTTFNA